MPRRDVETMPNAAFSTLPPSGADDIADSRAARTVRARRYPAGMPRSWVTKTDLTRYVRCPYAFWLLDKGLIRFDESISEVQAQLLQGGNEFEGLVQESAATVIVQPGEIKAVLQTDARVLGTPVFKNRRLRICGQPDGIDAAYGALIPVEIKSHKNVQRLDELELAFYWHLLEPLRRRHDVEPRGVLILRRDGAPAVVEVSIASYRLDEVLRLVEEVREARRRGVRPRVCGCHVCSVTRRDEVLDAVRASRDLTMIFGIGPVYSRMLQAAGIATWENLVDREPEEIVAIVPHAGIAEADRWQTHAVSYKSGYPIGPLGDVPAGESFIVLDLEYNTFDSSRIWLAGASVVSGGTQEYVTLWADDPLGELRVLEGLATVIEANPALPVLTWGGVSADIPALQLATSRWPSVRSGIEALFSRHSDMYLFARDNVRLPIPGLSLKEVADYFGIPRISDISGGFQAQMMYSTFQRTGGESLRDRLIDYNRDDLDALVGVTHEFQRMARSLHEAIASLEVVPADERIDLPEGVA